MMYRPEQPLYYTTKNNENSPTASNQLLITLSPYEREALFMPMPSFSSDEESTNGRRLESPPPVLLMPRLDHSERPIIVNMEDLQIPSLEEALPIPSPPSSVDSNRTVLRMPSRRPRKSRKPFRDITPTATTACP